MADAKIKVDTTELDEVTKKLYEVLATIERIYALIDKSWLLRLVFYGRGK